MALFGPGDRLKTVKLPRLGKEGAVKLLRQIGGLKRIEDLYADLKTENEAQFIDELIQSLDLSFQYFDTELNRIPKSGPVILIANHPLGGIDALLLLKLLGDLREDIRIVGSELWKGLEPIAHHWGLETMQCKREEGMQECLKQEGALLVFPSPKISSHYKLSQRQLHDGEWDSNLIKEVQAAAVPVIPIYIKANQSLVYHLLQRLGPSFQDLKLPSEIRSYRNKPVTIRVGRAIYSKELAKYPELEQFSRFLRQRVYLLSNALSTDFRVFGYKKPEAPKEIAEEVPREQLINEYQKLLRDGALLEEKRNYQVFLCKAADAPNMIREIGRLREITFRAIGEGSNLALDLDSFDYHYHHLLLWDTDSHCLVGAYRLAIGSEIYPQYGHNGFYLSTLFKFKKRIRPMLNVSLEMGRAFVIPEHQQKPLPLFVLWNGIREVMRQHPELEYIVGCASISSSFSKFSRQLMVGFLLKNFSDASLAEEIRPRKPFKLKLNSSARDLVINSSPEDLLQFDRRIDELEPGELRFPPLIKKYLQQNALMVCFNVDPLFNNSLDGFMYIHRKNLEL